MILQDRLSESEKLSNSSDGDGSDDLAISEVTPDGVEESLTMIDCAELYFEAAGVPPSRFCPPNGAERLLVQHRNPNNPKTTCACAFAV